MASVTLLRPHLACPTCRCELHDDGPDFVCSQVAEHRYTRAAGVPVLLSPTEQASLGLDLRSAEQMRAEYTPGPAARAKNLVKWLVGANRHQPLSQMTLDAIAERADGLHLEIGSGVRSDGPNRVNLDIGPFPNVDVVGSALELPFRDDTFDVIRNEAVLEHVRDPVRMIAEIHRVLAPGGVCYTEVPFIQHFHAYPNDFQRYTVEGLKEAFRAFEPLETGVCVGPGSAFTALAGDYMELFTFTERRIVNDIVRLLPLILLWPLKYLDGFLIRNNSRAHELASGIFLLARKRNRVD